MKQRVALQVDLADRQVVGGPPPPVEGLELIGVELRAGRGDGDGRSPLRCGGCTWVWVGNASVGTPHVGWPGAAIPGVLVALEASGIENITLTL